MISKCSTLLFYLIFAVAAVPHLKAPAPREAGDGISIALRKRTLLTTSAGLFDKNKAIVASVYMLNKHRRNMINLKTNIGEIAFNPGAAIKPVMTIPADVANQLLKRQTEQLTDEDEDVEWAGTISIGGNQSFLVNFDTGSSDLWIPSASCKSSVCSSKSKFNANSSSTSVLQRGKTFSIEYRDGSKAIGPIYRDTVTIAGVNAKNQTFAAVTSLSSEFAGDPVDGVLGMAFPSISTLHRSPFFNTAQTQGSVQSNMFGFFLSQNGSQLYLGGTATNLYQNGTLEFHAVNPTSGYWQVPGASAKVNSSVAVSGFETIIDSGTTIMYGPTHAVKKLYSMVPGATLFDSANGFYSFPCDSVPNIAFNWGGSDWEITSANFNLGLTAEGASDCVGALVGTDLGLGSDVWLLGDSFMKNVYTAFDFDQPAVGFAALDTTGSSF